MKIDVFNHVFPTEFFEAAESLMPANAVTRWKSIETIWNMDARSRMMDQFDDYCQIISMSQPPFDLIAGPDEALKLAQVANDGMARICRKYPDHMPWFVASLPMNNCKGAIEEIDRVLNYHNAVGFQIHTNVNGKPLDSSEYRDIFLKIAERERPIWLHPTRPLQHADYITESQSHFEIFWGIGWAYETTAAMTRMVCSGLFDEIPNLRVIAHHWGAYVPHAEGRFPLWEVRNATMGDGTSFADKLKRPMEEYFREFWVDTAMFGATAASQAGFDFFGAKNSFFASDCPYDLVGGSDLIRKTISVIEGLRCTENEREMIYKHNSMNFLDL
ncbi:MAG: amidohydrolase [Rhodospirillaceae bacterium]|nr:amidohydrolase [Rhodospirillaceae bacterium]|tara:strand:+ start:6272 stop:7261 length:990 start_codon:yes stop_codon:yes gene_type:complete